MKYSPDDILERVRDIHYRSEDFEDGDLEERIFQAHFYTLEEVELSHLDESGYNVDNNLVLEYLEEQSEFPPIVILNFNIIDGCHRVRVAKLKGLKTIKSFVGYRN